MTAPYSTVNVYIDGRAFLGVRGRYVEQPWMRAPRARPVFEISRSMTWPQFWRCVSGELRKRGYSRSSLQLYRQVLRGLRDAGLRRPAAISPAWMRNHIESIACRDMSWSWIAANISVIRTAFDKLAGCGVTVGLRTPKRPHRLPGFLHQHEVLEILREARTIRDQLLLGLLYGCGLKVGEVCALRWRDVDLPQRRLHVVFARGTRSRCIAIPPALLSVLVRGVESCPADDYIFQGRRRGTHLSPRSVEYVLRNACRAVQIIKPVTAMTLRHSYAVHCLEMGMSVVALQRALGHLDIETTLVYEACLPDGESAHPFSRVRACYRELMVEPRLLPRVSPLAELKLPFVDDALSLRERAIRFWALLRAQVRDRFLALQGGADPPVA